MPARSADEIPSGVPDASREPEVGTADLSHQPAEAVIFDLDGTLIDSEPIYRLADETFFKAYDVSVPESDFDDFVGMGSRRVIEQVKERYGLSGQTDHLVAEKADIYLEIAHGRTTVFPPLRELVLQLLLRGVKLALATSSDRRILSTVIEETGLAPAFPVAVTSDDVTNMKPSPEVFVTAAKRLGVAPERCWVIEDSQYGIQAARAAGMGVIAVPAPGHETIRTFGEADLVIEGGSAELVPELVLDTLGLGPANTPAGVASARDGLAGFHELVYGYFSRYRRSMPWRETTDPYRILVSELMLQQTQADRVVPKYLEFVSVFESVQALAAASLQDVLAIWQGLGYNRRARYLHEAARRIVAEHDGNVPRSVTQLRSLPGVGAYTAGAVMAFAFNSPVVFLETNIRRVFLQVFFPGGESVPDGQLLPLIGATMDTENPREWYYALMDYGAHLATVFTNANRRSAHYRKQSPFAGSVREVRGAIIRVLTELGELDRDDLERRVAPGDERFAAALEGLVRDGLVLTSGNRVALT